MENTYTTLYIVRHGETDWNAAHRIQGHSNIPLNNVGEKQAKETAEKLKEVTFDAVFSSDLVRAQRTAEIIALERNLEVQTTERLREQHFGSFEGRPREEFLSLFNKWKDLSEEEKFKHTVADEESPELAVARLLTFLREVSVAYLGKTILIAAHGGLMRYLLVRLGEATLGEPKFIKNAGFIKLRSDGIDFFVDEVNGVEERK